MESWSHPSLSIAQIPVNALGRIPTKLRGFDPLLEYCISLLIFRKWNGRVSIDGTSKCSGTGSTCVFYQYQTSKKQVKSEEKKRERERERERLEDSRRARLTLAFFAKAPWIYTGARVNNSRSNFYRGGLCKHAKAACGFPYCILCQLLADRKRWLPYVGIQPWRDATLRVHESHGVLVRHHREDNVGIAQGGEIRKAMSCINGNTWRYWRSQDNALPYLITVYNI